VLAMTRASAVNTAQQQVTTQGSQVTITVQ